MTTLMWFARVLQPDGKPAAGLVVEVHVFNLGRGEWQMRGEGATGSDGNVRGRLDLPNVQLAGDRIELAPAVRLIESSTTPAVLSAAPRLSLTKRPAALAVDFGEITRMAEALRFVPPRAAARGVPDEALLMSGVALPPALRADVSAVIAGERASDLATGGSRPVLDEAAHVEALRAVERERDSLVSERKRGCSTRDRRQRQRR